MLVLCLYDYDGRASPYSSELIRCKAGKVIEVPNEREIEAGFSRAIKEDCDKHDSFYGATRGTSNKRTEAFERPSNARLLAFLPRCGRPRF